MVEEYVLKRDAALKCAVLHGIDFIVAFCAMITGEKQIWRKSGRIERYAAHDAIIQRVARRTSVVHSRAKHHNCLCVQVFINVFRRIDVGRRFVDDYGINDHCKNKSCQAKCDKPPKNLPKKLHQTIRLPESN
ncbi:hypothetical protein SDC9_184999 [bioreactor metagenome]|uniref:Uncharacterized protein n=1 Tax=bioreactor metagenome TaxID=1076179 RepID=A0A645HFG4_9ZZZZ